MTRDFEERAEDLGYWRWRCRDCGMSGWTDTTPDCACNAGAEGEDGEETE